jgi:hypothetical protein
LLRRVLRRISRKSSNGSLPPLSEFASSGPKNHELVAKQERSMRGLYKSAVMLDGGGVSLAALALFYRRVLRDGFGMLL